MFHRIRQVAFGSALYTALALGALGGVEVGAEPLGLPPGGIPTTPAGEPSPATSEVRAQDPVPAEPDSPLPTEEALGEGEAALADSPEAADMESDRPILIRARVVEDAQHQLEFDLKVSRDRDGAPMKLRAPFLYRLDTGPRTEFRLQTDFLTYQNPNLGFSDLSLGFKWNFHPGPHGTSVLFALELPTGSAGFADPGVEPTVVLIQDWQLSERWSVGLNYGATYKRDSDTLDYYWERNSAAQVSYALTTRTQLSVAGLLKTPDRYQDGITRTSAAVGLSHALDKRTRLNFAVSRSLSTTGDDYVYFLGWSRKL